MKLLFWRADYGETVESAEPFEVSNFTASDLEFAAELYAEHYWDNRDGWECNWPLEFHVSSEDEKLLGVVSVNMEARPYFYGREK